MESRCLGGSPLLNDALHVRRALAAAQQLLQVIEQRASENGVPCHGDATLPPVPAGTRLFLASNLHNNEALLPHYTLQLLQLLVGLSQGSAYVSIYESGSTDRTGGAMPPPPCSQVTHAPMALTRSSRASCAAEWLRLLEQLLALLQIPHTIVTGEPTHSNSCCPLSSIRASVAPASSAQCGENRRLPVVLVR